MKEYIPAVVLVLLFTAFCAVYEGGRITAEAEYKTAIIKATEQNKALLADKNKLIAERESELNYFKLKRDVEFKYIVKKIPSSLTCESLGITVNAGIK